jgi:hypothetical protein
MKTAFLLFFILIMLATLRANAGLPPTTLGGQQSATKPTTFNFKAPNYQATQIVGTTSLIETGNKNILKEPSFEGTTWNTAWTLSATTSSQASVPTDGAYSLLLVSTAASLSAVQDSALYASAFADGVQCLASVRIKTASALQVCARQAGVTSSTDCVTTATDDKWALYKVPFICGATSNGISIASSGSITGGAYIDEAFVGAVDLVQDNKSCNSVECETTFGIIGASGGGIVSQTMDIVNSCSRSGTGTYTCTFKSGVFTQAPSVVVGLNTGVNCGSLRAVSVSSSSFTVNTANGSFGTLYDCQYAVTVTKTGADYDAAQRLANGTTYSSQCGANCVDTFSARISDTGVVSNENVNFISGNCTNASTMVCTLNTGLFSVTPNCTVSVDDTTFGREAHVNSQSNTSFSIRRQVSGTTTASSDFGVTVSCQKQGADFVATRTIQGSFKEVMVSPGVTKPKTCYYAFGGASATLASPTECTTGTCVEVYDSCGTGTPPAWSATGVYLNLTFASGTFSNSSPISCKCLSWDTTATAERQCTAYFDTSDNTWATNSSGGYVVNLKTTNAAGTLNDAYTMVECSGQAP